MRFDEARAKEVFPLLVQAYQQKQGIYAEEELPEIKYLPKSIQPGSLLHAQLLYCTTPFVIANIPSAQVIQQIFEMLTQDPNLLSDIFRPRWWERQVTSKDIKQLLADRKLGVFIDRGQHKTLLNNARWLLLKFGQSPLWLYSGIETIEHFEKQFDRPARIWVGTISETDLYCRHYGRGGPKITRLLDHWLSEVRWNRVVGQVVPLIGAPADRWMRRILIELECFVPEEGEQLHHQQASAQIRQHVELTLGQLSLSPQDFAAATWLLGRYVCRKYGSDKQYPSKFCNRLCPVEHFCNWVVSPEPKPDTGLVNLVKTPRKKLITLF